MERKEINNGFNNSQPHISVCRILQVRQCWPSIDIPSITVASLHTVGYGCRVPLRHWKNRWKNCRLLMIYSAETCPVSCIYWDVLPPLIYLRMSDLFFNIKTSYVTMFSWNFINVLVKIHKRSRNVWSSDHVSLKQILTDTHTHTHTHTHTYIYIYIYIYPQIKKGKLNKYMQKNRSSIPEVLVWFALMDPTCSMNSYPCLERHSLRYIR